MSEIAIVLLKKFWPYLVAFALGAILAGGTTWKIQSFRVTSMQQEKNTVQQNFDQYIQDRQTEDLRNRETAAKDREKEKKAYEDLSKALAKEIDDGEVYRRCVAAGRCGVRVKTVPACTGNGLQAAGLVNGSSANPVPAGSGATAPIDDAGQCQALAADCAVTTLMLNRLQIGIEAQPGYRLPQD